MKLAAAVAAFVLLPALALAQDSGPALGKLDPQTIQSLKDKQAASNLSAPILISGPVDPATYRLGPGDQLTIQVWGRATRIVTLDVGPEGGLLLPEAGLAQVGGLTLIEARKVITDRVHREFRDVRIEIQLTRPRRFLVNVTGAVKKPGPVEATGSARVSDVLMADQFETGASRRRIELLHRDSTRERADLERLLRAGDGSRNPILRDGDVVQVPFAKEFVEVLGAVSNAGLLELAPDDSLATLLRLAGGALPSTAPEKVVWTHWATPEKADTVFLTLADVVSGAAGTPVHDRDRLFLYFVPEYRTQQHVLVLGEVAHPGAFPVQEGRTRLSQVLASSGGFLPTADLSAIRVHRRGENAEEKDPELERLLRLSRGELTASEYEALRTKLAGQREDYRVNWHAMRQDSAALDLLVRDGDIVRVNPLVSSIRIDGEVRRPAILTYYPGITVSECVSQAGGYTNRAWKKKVRITRAVTGQTLHAGDVKSIDPGDFIWVPEKPDRDWARISLATLSALAMLATVVLAVQALN